ncbi:hypothetical protein AB0K60_07315 [Thermopolyspora sp. NPDC052614]|uniref:hypothetical protein n=1 Tax=Thermopolyspora sp. NPDC052614 TaxID=3155682 RepID=UPI00341629E8
MSAEAIGPGASGLLYRAAVAVADVAGEYPGTSVYVGGALGMLAVLSAIAITRPRVFSAVLDAVSAENRFDRRVVLGVTVVMWSAGWPVTLLAILARLAWRR